MCKLTKHMHIFRKFLLTQSGASKGGLHGVAVFDAKSPHDDSSCALFALLHPEFTAIKGELRKEQCIWNIKSLIGSKLEV